MKKIEFYLGIGYANAEHIEILEFDDDVSEEEIDQTLEDWSNNYIEISWNEVE